MSDEDSLLEEEENEPSNDSLEEVKEANEGLEESGKNSQNQTYTVEEAVEKLGFGAFQLIVTVFSGLLWVADAMELMLLSVLSPAVKCQWNLSSFEEAIITSVVFIGSFAGSLFWGIVCDKIGRKKGLFIIDLAVLVFGVLSAVPLTPADLRIPGYPWLLVCRFGVGFSAAGTLHAVTYYSEFLPKRARGVCITLVEVWWAFGSMFGAALAVAVMPSLGWHWYLGIAATPLALVLLFFPFVPESARFYVVNGKLDKAEKVIKTIAWFNCRDPPKGRIVSFEEKERLKAKYRRESLPESAYCSDIDGEEIVSDTAPNGPEIESNRLLTSPEVKHRSTNSKLTHLKSLFVNKMWQTSLPLMLIWFGCAWQYYGVVLLTTSLIQNDPHCGVITNATNKTCEELSLKTNDYIKILWAAAAELPGLILTALIIEFLGRKKTMAVEFTACMGGFLLLYICTVLDVITIFLFLIRAFAAGVFMAVYVYTPEIYPTSVRATAMGFCSGVARVGAILTPFVAQVLLGVSDYATFALYASSCLVLTMLAVLLPIETKGRSMKDEGK